MNAPAAWRPVPARWFELLTGRDEIARALEALAATGSVELEAHSETTSRLALPSLNGRLDELHRLAQRYRPWWPAPAARPQSAPAAPAELVERALAGLARWRAEADPLITELETLRAARADLLRLSEALAAMAGSPLEPALLGGAGPVLAAKLFLLPAGGRVAERPPGVIAAPFTGPAHEFLAAAGPPDEVAALERAVVTAKGRALPLPAELPGSATAARAALAAHLSDAAARDHNLSSALERAHEHHELPQLLGDLARLEWFLTHAQALPVTDNFAWVTGWTDDFTGVRLQAALARAGIHALVRFPPAPRGRTPPMVLMNPGWAQPFELFARLLGTPAREEADPSRLLAVVVPLLFGYMFGDVGQGMVLAAAGLLLSRRQPGLRLLVSGGLAAVAFGLLFGSVFSREMLPPLWLDPLDAPLTVLVVPLFAGAALLLAGLLLSGVEAAWRGEGRRWLLQEAGVVPLYLGLLALPFSRWALVPAALGTIWYLAGSLLAVRRAGEWLGEAARLLETLFQLLINTLSFARVGAFALAHAGLSSAVAALAEAAGGGVPGALVELVGNGVIIVLEGLVVSIQITRLVLFEFFIRFLRGEGRSFRPLAAPAVKPSDKGP